MSQQQNSLPAWKEARLGLALKAIKRDATLSQRRAAAPVLRCATIRLAQRSLTQCNTITSTRDNSINISLTKAMLVAIDLRELRGKLIYT
jgi:hypothetical protein